MNDISKFAELDKLMSKKIMKEFEGQTIDHTCDVCGGVGIINKIDTCENRDGTPVW